VVNALTRAPVLGPAGRWAAGVDRRRGVPRFAEQTFRAWFAGRPEAAGDGIPVALFVDTFTENFAPQVGRAAVRALESAGYRVLLAAPHCCGLTWISTGQLDAARRILRRAVGDLAGFAERGVPIVGLEPSCTAVLRNDGAQLLDSPEAAAVARSTRTLAELLMATDGWRPPDLAGTAVVAQPHCHHQSVLGWSADATLLEQAGAHVTRLGGCCGLAGNFGVERGHYDVSVKVAQTQLLPALSANRDAAVLADGFSCRSQITDLAGRASLHLAELLAPAER
jgi:Fe-S oxidoreductase